MNDQDHLPKELKQRIMNEIPNTSQVDKNEHPSEMMVKFHIAGLSSALLLVEGCYKTFFGVFLLVTWIIFAVLLMVLYPIHLFFWYLNHNYGRNSKQRKVPLKEAPVAYTESMHSLEDDVKRFWRKITKQKPGNN